MSTFDSWAAVGKEGGHFPGGPVVKNLPARAGDMGSISGPGNKISHTAGQLSSCATLWSPVTTTEPAHPRTRALQREKPLQ